MDLTTFDLGLLEAEQRAARVLIVEDEALLAEELRRRIGALGADVVGVESCGEDALASADHVSPDVVLMDIHLRGTLDGIDTAAALRDRVDAAVVFITAHADDQTVDRAKRVGPYGYLLKPVDPRDLRITLAMVLHKLQAERRLRASEARFETTLSSIGDAVISANAAGHVTFLNPVAEALTRWSRLEAIGRPAREVFALCDGTTGAALQDPFGRAMTTGTIVTLPSNTMLVARDGAQVPICDSVAPIMVRRVIRGAVAVFRIESGDARTVARLKLAEDRLRQTEKLESLGRLAGGVAHDINNMMTVVLGCADLLLARHAASGDVTLLRELRSAADRSIAMVRQLLAFSRTQILSPVRLDLRDVITDLAVMLRRLIEANVDIDYVLGETPALVQIDRAQLEQVVINLALNARDAMPHGGRLTIGVDDVEVDGSLRPEGGDMPPGTYVRLSVSDTGFGMDPITRARIFEPFFTTKEHGKGTGLGLATVYGVVKQSGGQITVYSELGQGSVFRVYLPRVADARAEAPEQPREAPTTGRERVLLVEGEDAVRVLVTTYLRDAGYHVVAASNGHEAVRLADTLDQPVDLLLTDVVMPYLGGRALASELRKRFPSVRVLFMSGYTEDRVLRQGIAEDDVAYLQKPFSAAVLLQRVRSVLDAR